MKTCARCKQLLPFEMFTPRKGRPPGQYRSYCKPCAAEYNRDFTAKRKADGVPSNAVHGEPRIYEHYGCRCDVCVTAAKWRNISAKYRMTEQDFNLLLVSQGGGCAVCGRPDFNGRGWQIDHDHGCCDQSVTCGKCVRGILCSTCNQGMGQFSDDPDILLAAAAYLLQSRNVLEEV